MTDQRFEYRVETLLRHTSKKAERWLNEQAAQGWEFEMFSLSEHAQWTFVLKRPLRS
jgi:hypothetical protein